MKPYVYELTLDLGDLGEFEAAAECLIDLDESASGDKLKAVTTIISGRENLVPYLSQGRREDILSDARDALKQEKKEDAKWVV